MKTGVLYVAMLTALAVQQASAAFRNSCFGGRCGFQSRNSYPGYQRRYSQSPYQRQYQSNSYNSRFGPARSPFGHSQSRFSPSSGRNEFSSSRFGPSSGHFTSSRSSFSPRRSQFGGPSHFSSSSSSQFSSPSNQFGRFNQFGQRQPSFQSRFASSTPERRLQARRATSRQLAQRRRQEQHLLQSRGGIVQPGSPSAALAAEKRADRKSLSLGNQALEQILFLQNLVGSGGRFR